MGRDWLMQVKLDWRQLHTVRENTPKPTTSALSGILEKHKELFKDELGTIRGTKAKLHVDTNAQPKFFRPRTVPYALRSRVEHTLTQLEEQGVIEPVEFADWAAPIVPVVKKDDSIRICGDYKLTVNQAAKVDTHPLPLIDDLFASLAGGIFFSKLDLAHAYQQIVLDDEAKNLMVINTHKGLYRYNRLPFGISAAPAIFQRTMETILQGLSNVCVYLDDILVSEESEEAHLRNLEAVLTRLEGAGIRLKKKKCEFLLNEVEYLGHRISAKGLHPTNEKLEAVTTCPTPNDVTQLKSFLGLLTYYGKFLPNLSTLLAPLYDLLQKHCQWSWGEKQESAFRESKAILTSSSWLAHYDPKKELLLSCDASPYGVGAVLSHRMEDGSEQPVAFASRSLTTAERNYAQLDKEALAIIFGVKRFHLYLYGRTFTIYSDHQPLKHILSATKGIPSMASSRIQRWALTLSAYSYNIVFKPGAENNNADALSRLPLPIPKGSPPTPLPPDLILLAQAIGSSPITADQIRIWTDHDPLLSRIRGNVLRGWQDTTEPDMRPYQRKREELSVQDGCLLWGSRVVVPPPGREKVLTLLHEGHPGVARMKGMARSYVWWPGMDAELEERVKRCSQCQQHHKLPPVAPLHPWEWPQRPWTRVHADYAGPFKGKMFLLLVDAHSKWMEIHTLTTATSQTTIAKMRDTFATHGLPEILVTDNGTVFTSVEFETFLARNGIKHITSAPYHPATNGLAERAVQTIQDGHKEDRPIHSNRDGSIPFPVYIPSDAALDHGNFPR